MFINEKIINICTAGANKSNDIYQLWQINKPQKFLFSVLHVVHREEISKYLHHESLWSNMR